MRFSVSVLFCPALSSGTWLSQSNAGSLNLGICLFHNFRITIYMQMTGGFSGIRMPFYMQVSAGHARVARALLGCVRAPSA
jgi:hypothetical protein